jgi:hypothetical protein
VVYPVTIHHKRVRSVVGHCYQVAPPAQACGVMPDETRFEALRLQWHQERGATSSITEMALCRSYYAIIGMGPAVVPIILRQMEREGDEPDMWFWALQMITGVDPVPQQSRGRIKEMANAWIEWGMNA